MGSPNDNMTLGFSCECIEDGKAIMRTVKPFEFSPDNLRALYQQVSKFRTLMGREVSSMEDMIDFFLSENNGVYTPKGLCMIVDEFVGIFWLTDIIGLNEASVHYTFFDRRHRGRLELCKKAIEYAFETFKFHRLHTAVPVYEIGVMKFISSLGFIKTGQLRQNRLIRGKYYDTCLYDILHEEFINGIIPRELQSTD